MALLEPVTRKEQYLNSMAGESGDVPSKPITREEMFMAKAIGQDVVPPEPVTRAEMYLAAIAEGGGGGGGETGDGEMPVGDFLIRHWKTVTIGENTVKNGAELLTYFYNAIGVSSMPPLFSFAGVNKGSVANGYVAAGGMGFDGTNQPKGYRFRNKWETFLMTTAYECFAFVGDQYLVYWYEIVEQ